MLAHNLVTTWQRLLAPRRADFRPAERGRAAIHRYDPIDDFRAWTRCRDRAQFHLGRARRAKDRGRYREAAREIERALRFDDSSEAYFLVLGQCFLNGSPRDLSAARRALERALAINPRNGYTIKLLLRVYDAEGNAVGARTTLERALAGGAPACPWRDLLERYRAREAARLTA
jgi:tetratricopeptide (TPR) repeat protein